MADQIVITEKTSQARDVVRRMGARPNPMRLVFVPGVDHRALPLLPASSAAHKASVFERTASALAASAS